MRLRPLNKETTAFTRIITSLLRYFDDQTSKAPVNDLQKDNLPFRPSHPMFCSIHPSPSVTSFLRLERYHVADESMRIESQQKRSCTGNRRFAKSNAIASNRWLASERCHNGLLSKSSGRCSIDEVRRGDMSVRGQSRCSIKTNCRRIVDCSTFLHICSESSCLSDSVQIC